MSSERIYLSLYDAITVAHYGGPQVQNTTHTAKTQHTLPKHNTHSQNTTHTAKTQHTLPKHNTHCQNTTHTAKTQHTHCQNTTHTVKTQHASSDFTETQQTLSKQKKRHENTIQHTKRLFQEQQTTKRSKKC